MVFKVIFWVSVVNVQKSQFAAEIKFGVLQKQRRSRVPPLTGSASLIDLYFQFVSFSFIVLSNQGQVSFQTAQLSLPDTEGV